MEYEKGDLVWFDPGLGYVLPGEIIEFHRAGGVITVQALIGGKSQVFTLSNLSSVTQRQDLSLEGVNDMTVLGDIHEASVLWNIKIRYDIQSIYTYIGNMLVSVNPYQMLDIYSLETVKKYEGQIQGTLPPHIFAIASSAYSKLIKDHRSQCIVITGESGSGKTEATKLISQYLAAVNKSQSNLITEQILEASPILESFGNAATFRNNNSSRYGKYLELLFEGGVICGAKITDFLLEKSRIIAHGPHERNFHVFYELLAGLPPDEKKKYGLTDSDKYFYLNQGKRDRLENKNDAEDFRALLSAMQVLGITTEEQETIFKVLASILHLGNIYFHQKQKDGNTEIAEIGSDAEVKWVGHLLGIKTTHVKQCLTTRIATFGEANTYFFNQMIKGERVKVPLSFDQALDVRDEIAKSLYSFVFAWLVTRVNSVIYKKPKKTAISILDISGFECFQENGFEQLCINYANEYLHHYVIKHLFKLEQQIYERERIEWVHMDYQDNGLLLDMFIKKPIGLWNLLDDECNFPKSSDNSLLVKFEYNHALNDLYSRPRETGLKEFGIKHYAGKVWYSIDGFLNKNKDLMKIEVFELFSSSRVLNTSGMLIDARDIIRLPKDEKSQGKMSKGLNVIPRGPAIAARFIDNLQNLFENMSNCNPWFIHCIKPNNDKSPMKIDMLIVLEQLKNYDIVETIKMRQAGFPVKMRFNHFSERYRCLVPGKVPRGAPNKEICRVILGSEPFRKLRDKYQLGSTSVLMRESLERDLELERYKKLSSSVVTLQKYCRSYLARKRHVTKKQSVVKIQSTVRMWQSRKKYLEMMKAIVRLQAIAKGRATRRRFARMKDEMVQRRRVETIARQRAERQAAAQSKVDQANVQRSVAGVNHLEIPADLAYILSKSTDWSSPHGDKHISKASSMVATSRDEYNLPHDLDYHGFTKFTSRYFKSHLWKMKREPIKTPFLTKNRDADFTDSLAIFKLILRFMNDHTLSGTREAIHGNYIVNRGIENDRMRDEILCQLANQTWHNDNKANVVRGWLLMANCLSVFPPSSFLYKFILKYVTDHGQNGYAGLCQRKILSSAKRSAGVARSYPPSDLEWQANRRKLRMALEGYFADGQSKTQEVDSWTTCSEFASQLLSESIGPNSGWTVALSHNDLLVEASGFDYILDLITEKEIPTRFPDKPSPFIKSGPSFSLKENYQPRSKRSASLDEMDGGLIQETPLVPRMTKSPPPLTRKLSREALEAHDQVMSGPISTSTEGGNEMDLSRTSALNNRYFDEKTKSRSLDNLIENQITNNLDLSDSRLNERYHSVERLVDQHSNIYNKRIPEEDETDMRSPRNHNLQRTSNESASGKGLAASKVWNKFDLNEDRTSDDFSRITGGGSTSSRYIKGSNAGRRAYPGSHSRSHNINIDRGDYSKSSAMSDTSEAPSLASHVRRVRVPSQASDVDQFLDDLFLPVLQSQSQLDELSDVRSLAASLKGGSDTYFKDDDATVNYFIEDLPLNDPDDIDEGIVFARTRQFGSFRRRSLLNALQDIELNPSLSGMDNPEDLVNILKGGGGGTADVDSSGHQLPPTSGIPPGPFFPGSPIPHGAPGSPPPFMGLATMPLYSPGGVAMPGVMPQDSPLDHSQIANYSIQRAFLQSAVTQNMQIQQQLLAQNQAIQQLLSQTLPVSFQEPQHKELWSTEKIEQNESLSFGDEHFSKSPGSIGSPRASFGTPNIAGLAYPISTSSPIQSSGTKKKHSASSNDDSKVTSPRHESPARGPAMSPRAHIPPQPGHIPPPPPMPTDLDEMGFFDQYKRAKTVRIGKWRWPPAKETLESASDSFMEFKLRKNSQKMTRQDSSPKNSKDESGLIEWEEFEIAGSGDDNSPRTQQQMEVANRMYQQYRLQQQELFQLQHQHQMKKQFMMGHNQNQESSDDRIDTGETLDVKTVDSQNARRRRDSWDNPVEDNNKSSGGIGKLKISREMREKLEAVTSSHTSRTKEPARTPVKKLQAHRTLLLKQQLEGDGWDTIDKKTTKFKGGSAPPPPPIAPPNMNMRRPPSPSQSLSSQESSQVVPHQRLPPPPVQPSAYRGNLDFRERRPSVSTLQTEKNEHIELEESSEFLPSVDRAPILIDEELEQRNFDGIKSVLHPPLQGPHLTYSKVPWKLMIRKEIFTPNETMNDEALHLIFCQVVQDVYAGITQRIQPNQRKQMRKLLDNYGITPNNTFSPHHKLGVKEEIVNLARSWPLYFSAIFHITSSRGNDAQMVAISQSGVKLLRLESSQPQILESYDFTEIEYAECKRQGSFHLHLTGGFGILLYTPRANQVASLIRRFLTLSGHGSKKLRRAAVDYTSRDPSALNFRKGDIIKLEKTDAFETREGYLVGTLNGQKGTFPSSYVVPLNRNSREKTSSIDGDHLEITNGIDNGLLNGDGGYNYDSSGGGGSTATWTHHHSSSPHHHSSSPHPASSPHAASPQPTSPLQPDDSGNSSGGEGIGSGESTSHKQFQHDGKHSLLQFALQHFREAKEKGMMSDGTIQTNISKKKKKSKDGSEWTWKEQVEMVKFSPVMITKSLLPLPNDLSQQAQHVFMNIMLYMGDIKMPQESTDVQCVYNILTSCHTIEAMRDEFYCQIMKQTTNNKSSVIDSCQRGWRLFSIIAAYFTCSENLQPCLIKYLETAAFDKRRAFHGTAMVCLQNLRKTFKYGGRKSVPSVDEITAITAGRSSKRQIYRLPGGTEKVINTKSTTVVQDIIEELCVMINVRSPSEQEEFSLYCIVEGETYTMPLSREEYVLDITTELLRNQQVFFLIFCRSVYYHELRFDNSLYIEVIFNQIAPDYIQGLLLIMPNNELPKSSLTDLTRIAPLMHRAAGLSTKPSVSEIKFMLPKPALSIHEMKPSQWTTLVQQIWPQVANMTPFDAKAQVLQILKEWPLFGSAFFLVKRVLEMYKVVDNILALNKKGVHFLDSDTHETVLHYPLSQVMSARKGKTETGELYLDLKCGNLMQQKITRIKTENAYEISRLIKSYISMEQRFKGNEGDQPNNVTLSRDGKLHISDDPNYAKFRQT